MKVRWFIPTAIWILFIYCSIHLINIDKNFKLEHLPTIVYTTYIITFFILGNIIGYLFGGLQIYIIDKSIRKKSTKNKL